MLPQRPLFILARTEQGPRASFPFPSDLLIAKIIFWIAYKVAMSDQSLR
jgi:hypothetical protein